MKRAISLFVLLLLIQGCAADEAPDVLAISEGGGQAATQSEGGNAVYGRVDSIVGNEVVLELGEPNSSARGGGSADAGNEQAAESGAETARGERGERPSSDGQSADGQSGARAQRGSSGGGNGSAATGDGASRGEIPQGMPDGGGMQGGGQESAGSGGIAGGAGGGSVELTYTGETATYLLPVGMQIGSGDFSSVTAGMVLRISLNATGTITAVSILSR